MSFDLTTNFGGLQLNSPLVVGSCPMNAEELQRIALISNGAGAIVLPSLFEQRVKGKPDCPDNLQYDLDSYLSMLEQAKRQSSIPLFASINGRHTADWRPAVAAISAAGADAIEFSIRRSDNSQKFDPREIEDGIVDSVKQISSAIEVPLIIKLTREFTCISDLAGRLEPYICGLVLFGRAPAIDVELDSLKKTVKWGLTEPGSIVHSLESIIRLRTQHPNLSIAACDGIGTSIDFIKALLAGASVAMVTSAVYRDGASVIDALLQGLIHFMEKHNLQSMSEFTSTGLVEDLLEEIDFLPWSEQNSASNAHFVCDRYGHAQSVE